VAYCEWTGNARTVVEEMEDLVSWCLQLSADGGVSSQGLSIATRCQNVRTDWMGLQWWALYESAVATLDWGVGSA